MKNTKPTLFHSAKAQLFTVAAVAMIVAAGQAKAQVINFDTPGGVGGTNFNGQGALSDPNNNYWNPIAFNNTTSSTGLESDGITSTGVTLTTAGLGNSYNPGQGGIGLAPDGTDLPVALFDPFAYTQAASPSYTLTLNNVAAGSYNLFLYATNNDSGNLDSTVFTIGSQSLTVLNAGDTTFVEGSNYVEFTGISPVDGVISITATHGAAGVNGEIDFNGLQLAAAEVPEPSAYALLLAGLGSMIVLLRNKRVRI